MTTDIMLSICLDPSSNKTPILARKKVLLSWSLCPSIAFDLKAYNYIGCHLSWGQLQPSLL
jgi:hypothetical protein